MDAQLSVPSLVLVTLDDRLEARTSPKDEDVVSGILASIFSVVPALVTYKYDEVLKENGLADVQELRELTRADLISLGVPLGRAKKILRVLQPSGSPQPTVVGQQPTIKVFVKAIPALGANGFPSRRPWTAYEAVFTAGLGMHQLPVERIKLVSESFLKPSAIIGAGHVDGDFVDQLIWNALATAGPDGMPDELMLADPLQLRVDRWGLKAVGWISSAVLTSSDDWMLQESCRIHLRTASR